MKKLFLNIFFLIAGILTIFIVFLSTLGYETDKLNVFFSSQISNYNKDAIIKFKKIKIKLDLKKLNIYISTKEPKISSSNFMDGYRSITSEIYGITV